MPVILSTVKEMIRKLRSKPENYQIVIGWYDKDGNTHYAPWDGEIFQGIFVVPTEKKHGELVEHNTWDRYQQTIYKNRVGVQSVVLWAEF